MTVNKVGCMNDCVPYKEMYSGQSSKLQTHKKINLRSKTFVQIYVGFEKWAVMPMNKVGETNDR